MSVCNYDSCVDLHETYFRVKPFRKYSEIETDDDFLCAIKNLLEDENVCKTKNYVQHGNTTCYQHQLSVAYYTYRMCKKLKLNADEAARGAMLHDFFLYDWHKEEKITGFSHAFNHPKRALENAKKIFELTSIEEDVIIKHMWPLTFLKFPKYPETFIVTVADKICCIMEVICSIGKKETIG